MGYENYDVGTITKNGVDVQVRFATFDGTFRAGVGEQSFSATTWDEIGAKVDKATRRVRKAVAVPFTQAVDYYASLKIRNGTATGIHSANSNVLVTWDDGTKEQIKSGSDLYKPLSEDDRTELKILTDRFNKARDDLREFKQTFKIDLRREVSEALDKAQ